MDHLWSPWRYKYIASAAPNAGCVFCRARDGKDDRESFVVWRGAQTFIILNIFPYTSGHLMIVPFEHEASLAALDEATTTEMMETAKRAQIAIVAEYRPDGFNIGRSEEHTSELQSLRHLVCRLLLEKKKRKRQKQ